MTFPVFFAAMFFYFYASKKLLCNDHGKNLYKKMHAYYCQGSSPDSYRDYPKK